MGMAKDRVLELTSAGCELKSYPISGTDRWCARPMEKVRSMRSRAELYEDCHYLQFKNGALAEVEKQISEANDDRSADIMSRVYSFILGVEAGRQSVRVSIDDEKEYKKHRLRTIIFTAGDRSLNLYIAQTIGSPGSRFTLTESLTRQESRVLKP
jgi:hypothetical protein